MAGAVIRVDVPGPFDPEVVFRELFAEAPDAFWIDGPTTWLGVGSEVTTFHVAASVAASGLRSSAVPGRPADLGSHVGPDAGPDAERVFPRRRKVPSSAPRGSLLGTERATSPLPGGWVGYLGYGAKALARGGQPHPVPGHLPDAQWMWVDRVIALDRETDAAAVLALEDGEGEEREEGEHHEHDEHREEREEREDAESWVAGVADRLRQLAGVSAHSSPRKGPFGTEKGPFRAREEAHSAYLEAIDTIKGHLARGESYEVCLTRTLTLPPVRSPLALHTAMRTTSPTGRSAYLRFGELAVCSATPEEFLTVTAEGTVTARPIKGTAARHPDPAIDQALADALATDPKTRAENLMIVDLLRNDLNQVCTPGTVDVPRFLEVESYATVHQLVSTVTGRLEPGRTAVDAICAAFPPGSMTGAPKERTMEIIDALEPAPREIYSGVLGILGADGSADLRVVIRTAVCTPGAVTVGTGGAITWLSDPEDEWEETELKVRAVVAALDVVRKNEGHG